MRCNSWDYLEMLYVGDLPKRSIRPKCGSGRLGVLCREGAVLWLLGLQV